MEIVGGDVGEDDVPELDGSVEDQRGRWVGRDDGGVVGGVSVGTVGWSDCMMKIWRMRGGHGGVEMRRHGFIIS